MSKLKLSSSATGTGNVTLKAPITNNDYELVLPLSTGNIVVEENGQTTINGTVTVDDIVTDGIVVDGPSTFYGNGNATIAWGDTIADGNIGHLSFDPSGNAVVRALTGKDLKLQVNQNQEAVSLGSTSAVFNEAGGDVDFRVESAAETHMLFVEAANNIVMMGKSATAGDVTTTGHLFYSGGKTVHTSSSVQVLVLANTQTTGTAYPLDFFYGGSSVGRVSTTSTGTTYLTTSDRRLKDNIETITDGTDKLMAMNPVTHTWKADPDAPAVHGFIAQEMQDIVPEAVSGDPESEDMMAMDYGRITPILVAALQDAHKKIEALEARINEMEEK